MRPTGRSTINSWPACCCVATAKLALVTGTFIILWRLLAPEAEPPDDDDRRTAIADAPPPAPAWYASLDSTLPSEPAPARHPEPLSAER